MRNVRFSGPPGCSLKLQRQLRNPAFVLLNPGNTPIFSCEIGPCWKIVGCPGIPIHSKFRWGWSGSSHGMILKYHGSIGSWAFVPGCRQCRQCKHAVKLNQYEQLVNRMRISNSKKYDTGMCILYPYMWASVWLYVDLWQYSVLHHSQIRPRFKNHLFQTTRPISACCPHSKNELVYTVATKKKMRKVVPKWYKWYFYTHTHTYIYIYVS